MQGQQMTKSDYPAQHWRLENIWEDQQKLKDFDKVNRFFSYVGEGDTRLPVYHGGKRFG
jgi:hypothetical protein